MIKETIEEAATGTPSAPDARIQTRPTQTVHAASGEEQQIASSRHQDLPLIVYANQRITSSGSADSPQLMPIVRKCCGCDTAEISRDDDFNYAINILNSIPDLTNTSGITDTFSGVSEAVYNRTKYSDRLLLRKRPFSIY